MKCPWNKTEELKLRTDELEAELKRIQESKNNGIAWIGVQVDDDLRVGMGEKDRVGGEEEKGGMEDGVVGTVDASGGEEGNVVSESCDDVLSKTTTTITGVTPSDNDDVCNNVMMDDGKKIELMTRVTKEGLVIEQEVCVRDDDMM